PNRRRLGSGDRTGRIESENVGIDAGDRGGCAMILVIDHYDSFVYNLVQLVESLGYETLVVRSDEKPVDELIALDPQAVILSPGAGTPEAAGCMIEVLGKLPDETRLLGVGLGDQAMGVGFGGWVWGGAVPCQGRASR